MTNKTSLKNQRNYHVLGCSSQHHPKINAVTFSKQESFTHILGKTIIGAMLKKYGQVNYDEELMLLVRRIDDLIEKELMKDFVKDPHDFIMEAVPNNNIQRRIDVVDLKTNDHYEAETDHTIKKEGAITIKV